MMRIYKVTKNIDSEVLEKCSNPCHTEVNGQ